MRVALTSDLHLDLIEDPRRRELVIEVLGRSLLDAHPDVVVVAGDVANHHSLVSGFLAPLAVARHNLYVPGNHDIWLTGAEIERGLGSDQALAALAEAASRAGFHPLVDDPIVIDGWVFAGTLGWYDYTFAQPELGISFDSYADKRFGGSVYQDRTWVRWRVGGRQLTDPEVTSGMLDLLERQLRAVGVDEGGGPPTIVVSHHIPYRQAIAYQGYADYDYFSAFMGSQAFGVLYDRFPSVVAAFAGHTHRPVSIRTDSGRMLVISPLGYYGSLEYPRQIEDRVAVVVAEGRSLKVIRAPC